MDQPSGGKAARRNLHAYFTQLDLPNLRMPPRRYFTTNDPVMTPALLVAKKRVLPA